MYYLKYQDEYGNVNYYTDLKNNIVKFNTVKEAKAKAKELTDDEYSLFNMVVSRYYVVEVSETIVDYQDTFKIFDDKEHNTCILSATKDAVSNIDLGLEGVKNKFDYEIISDKTYKNGSRAVEFVYKEKENTEYDIVIAHEENTFVIAYYINDYEKVNKIASHLNKGFGKHISYFVCKRENDKCSMTFTVKDKVSEFKDSLFKLADESFKVKYL